MKKILYLLSIGLMVSLLGCGTTVNAPESTTPVVDQVAKQEADGKKAIDDLRTNAVKADFVEINGHYDQVKHKAVFAEGKVSAVSNSGIPSFLLSQKEGSGWGIYYIVNTSSIVDLKSGDTVKVYGYVSDTKLTPAACDGPVIWCSIVEKK